MMTFDEWCDSLCEPPALCSRCRYRNAHRDEELCAPCLIDTDAPAPAESNSVLDESDEDIFAPLRRVTT